MKRVLVTGGRGFIGRHTLPLLVTRGYQVHATTSAVPALFPCADDVEWHQVDLTVPEQTAALIARVQPSHLLHLAWYTKHGVFWASPRNLDWLAGSALLVKYFHASGGQRLVAAGTCAEYAPSGEPCREYESPLVPESLYGACKHAFHLALAAAGRQAQVSTAWGRIFHLYGPNESPNRLVPSVMRSLLNGEVARCTDGIQLRDFLHVHDVAGAFVALLDSDVMGAVNVGSPAPVRVHEVVERIGRLLGRPDLIRLGALPANPADPQVLVPDITRLTHEVRWTPEYTLQEGLEHTAAWWRTAMSASSGVGQDGETEQGAASV